MGWNDHLMKLLSAIMVNLLISALLSASEQTEVDRPNILFAVSDDQSWPHAGAYGDSVVQTPTFDSVARNGALFQHAYASAPSCTPSRAAILTGQHHWRLGKGANLHSTLQAGHACYTELLEEAGYHTGYTGKGWGPGDWSDGGRDRDPAGEPYRKQKIPKLDLPATGISNVDYAENFTDFLAAKPEDPPFCFWFGASEPHREYEDGSGERGGKRPEEVEVPGHLPDHPDVRGDILDYYLQIEWFDRHLARMLAMLEERGELANTLVVVTSDNGMPFPRSKTTLYDSGVRLPLAVQWPAKIEGGQVIGDLVHFVDFAPTFLDVAGLEIPGEMTGQSLLPLLNGTAENWRRHVVFGRERHTLYANDGRAYSSRGIRTRDFLLIRNAYPKLWPGGSPPHYTDIDRGPSKFLFMTRPDHPAVAPLVAQTLGRHPEIEIYDCRNDPSQLVNLAQNPEYEGVRARLENRLDAELKRLGDPRALGEEITWDSDPYHGSPKENWIERQAQQLEEYRESRELEP